jgi:choline dehydrogenase
MNTREAYDYIVVGAGSAGCVVAARLSEDPGTRVAVIEAGPPAKGRLFDVPALFPRQLKSAYDWDFESEPEPRLNRRRNYLPRGRMVGGTGSMNSMLYVRGNRADYDAWPDLGAPGWSFDDVLPFFRRSEDNERGEDEFHAVGGPLRVSDARSVHPLLEAWVEAAKQAGHPASADFNGADQEGVGLYQVTQRDGLRWSPAKAFLEPALARPNLDLFHSTLALRIVWEGTRAIGMEVDHLSETRIVYAEREIVLAAGAYQSPHLLLLSGVGPADELREAGVEPRVDLPGVGRNLHDHAGSLLALPTITPHLLSGDTSAEEQELLSQGQGPMIWNEAGAFLRSNPSLEAPDLQFHSVLGVSYDEGLGPATRHGISFGPYVARPRSRGWVKLRTCEPYSKPRIQHNFLADESDRIRLRDGIRLGLEIARQSALATHLADTGDAAKQGFIPESESDQAIDEFLARTTFAFYHPVGSCAMGSVTDPMLRVRGVEGVRVADTSVMPQVPTGNTNAPAIMIGERAAHVIATGSLEANAVAPA